MSLTEALTSLVLLWAVIDPIGTIPVFLSVARGASPAEQARMARQASLIATGILLFFIVIGELLLRAMGVELYAFQIAGGVILFLFALTMVFGESKPESELRDARPGFDRAVFPLATPSIASPGAIMAVVLLTENNQHSLVEQAITTGLMLAIIAVAYGMMRLAGWIHRWIGNGGASLVSRVMGLILASIATTQILEGVRTFILQLPQLAEAPLID